MTAPRFLLLALAAVLGAPAQAGARPTPNPIHPTFTPLDAAGTLAARPEDVSAAATCGACHDADWIAAHDGHAQAGVRVTCIQCHVDGGRLAVGPLEGGKLRREDLQIGRPSDMSCAACHGLVAVPPAPVAVPAEFEHPPGAGRSWSLTQGEGAVVSPERKSASFLNLEGKAGRSAPWDAHAAKLVGCVDCHHARNDPRRADLERARLRYVASDPRRTSTGEFLFRPDHRLSRAECRSCHAPLEVHAFLPYRARHLEVLGCAACHVPGPMGPAVQMIDATVVTAAGAPIVAYRNVERREGEPLGAALVRPLRPLYVLRTEADGARRLAPVNVVSRWRWVSGPGGAAEEAGFARRRGEGEARAIEVPPPTVGRAFREGDGWAAPVLAALDADRDGDLSAAELRLDTPAKVEVIAARLRAAGVADPRIDGLMEAHPLAHGVAGREEALRDCGACHGEGSRLDGAYALAAWLPGGVPPRPPEGGDVELAGTLAADGAGLALQRAPGSLPGLHVLGRSRHGSLDTAGMIVFGLVLAGVLVHGGARVVLRRRRNGPSPGLPPREVYVFGRYERIWHWTMAASGLGLVATGFVIRAGTGPGLGAAVAVHDVLATVLIVNASLALFWHVTTAAIRSFLPEPRGLLGRILEHIEYQTRGIFRGRPDPALKEGQKLNPLQQLTYLALLNVLFPLQIVTGALVWAVGHWPGVAAAVGGLSVVAPLHGLGAWLFLAFFTLHVYLVTTGRTAGEHLHAMVTGYRRVHPAPPEGASP